MENTSRLFVGNLSWGIRDEELMEMFKAIGGVVSANVVTDRFSGKSKGFGFVEMESPELAQKAIEELNGKEIDGRAINVSIAKPPQAREDRGGFNRRDDSDRGDRRDYRG